MRKGLARRKPPAGTRARKTLLASFPIASFMGTVSLGNMP